MPRQLRPFGRTTRRDITEAKCRECNYRHKGWNAIGAAQRHHRRTGHVIAGTIGYRFVITPPRHD